ncbi:RidA family protein [Mycolicibacterium sp.]|uniref:RidA family protein n=1 Tax=Mycolicibacterium sp. TaxID=2320850 RepID=UPI003D13E9CE
MTTLPPPAGPYSASVRRDNLVFTAGQCGYHADRSLAEGLENQIRVALHNLQAALALQSATLADVVSVNVFLAHSEDFDAMNAVYREFFTADPLPARTTVTVGLRRGVLFEVNAQAVLPQHRD